MKPLRLASLAIATAAFLPYLGSCVSDANPFDNTIKTDKTDSDNAKIRLNLDVANTRSDDPFSTTDEQDVKKVNVYVFDEHNQLEKFEANIVVSSSTPAELEITSGLKTIYAISGKNVLSSTISTGTKLEDFEETIFSSTLGELKTTDGFAMVGKSAPQLVLKSSHENDVPSANVFTVNLVRLLSKTQVKYVKVDGQNAFGFTEGNATFRVCQVCDQMRLVADHTKDIQDSYTDSKVKGTYDGYTVCPNETFINAVKTNFTAKDCHYLTENIVQNPVAGNTTFISLRVPFTPYKLYSFDQMSNTLVKPLNNPSDINAYGTSGMDFFVVGVVDKTYGFEDFALDPDNNHVIAFGNEQDAKNYAAALNGGQAAAFTVSESESPLKAPAAGASSGEHRQFQSIKFTGGLAYYRINITTGSGNIKVERNKFYKITVNSIKNLGFHSEDLLRPEDPSSDPGNSTTAWIESAFTVADWDEVQQSTDL